jgi:hypothetical protein
MAELEKIQHDYKNFIEQKHPNSLAFDSDGRLFVGDSFGQINTWRIDVQNGGNVVAVEHFLIKHKEIEGDQINNIIIHSEKKNQIYV